MIECDVIFHAMSGAIDVIKVDVMYWLHFMTVIKFEICYYFTNRHLILRADVKKNRHHCSPAFIANF